MEKPPSPERKKEKTFVVFGENGHENEYVFTMPYTKTDEISSTIAHALTERFAEAGWEVLNRGSRLEISHKSEFGKRNDEEVCSLMRSVLGENTTLRSWIRNEARTT